MPPVVAFTLTAIVSLLALVSIALLVREAVSRLNAGPVRFRLAIASWAVPWRGAAAYGWARMFLFLGVISLFIMINQKFFAHSFMLMIALVLCALSFRLPRRDAKRWLVLAAGLLSLVVGAVVLAVGLRAVQAGDRSAYHLPGALMLVCSVILFVVGAAVIQDSILGTRVRERGIEMFCTTQPWSRVVVKGWHACEGGFALHLAIISPRLFGIPLEDESEIIIPVSASQRPALEVFLTGHAATVR
ncbi:MAG: hypothetical protein ACHRXM_06820 [Isosphaerales bacterium]